MVSLLTSNSFGFLIAKRNLLANKKTTAVIIITLSLIFAVFMLMSGIRSIYKDVFTKEAINRYPASDIIISYDEYSPARFINKRLLVEDYDEIQYALAFFNLQVLTEHDNEIFYSIMFSSLQHEFEILLDVDIEIKNNEAIITDSYAKKHQLLIGDSFKVYIIDNELEFIVKDILKDNKSFSGDSFFVDKTEVFEKLYSLNYLNNFGNIIYLRTDNIEETFEKLKTDPNYQNYSINLVVDEEIIDGIVAEYTSMIVVAGIIGLIALLIVLNSLFLIVLRDIFQEISVFETLGDNDKLGYKVCFNQWLYYIITSFILGFIIAHLVIGVGASFYGAKGLILINPLVILFTLLVITGMIFFKNWILLKKHYQENIISKIRDKRYVLGKINYYLLSLFLVLLLIIIIFEPFSLKYNSLLIVLLSIYLSLNILVLVLKIIVKIIGRTNTVFALFNCKYMDNNKNLHQSMVVIFLALIVVGIMVTVRMFIANEIELVKSDNKFDLVMVNINDYEENLIDELSAYGIEKANPALVYSDIMVNINENKRILIRNFVSLNLADYYDYFDYKLDSVPEEYINNEYPYLLLPKSYEQVYGKKIGDIISIDLSPDLRDISFIVGGFIDTNYDHFIYSNLYDKVYELDLKYNSIIMNSNNPSSDMEVLIRNYSPKMYYVINANNQLDKQLDLARNVLALFTVITIFIVFSFIFVVFNNTMLKFYSLKNDYAKIKVLGISDKANLSNLFKELGVVILVLIIVGMIEILVLSRYLRYLLLFFDYYKELIANPVSIAIAYFTIATSMFFSYLYYFYLIKKVEISTEIKMY